jgi:hypothetical protein
MNGVLLLPHPPRLLTAGETDTAVAVVAAAVVVMAAAAVVAPGYLCSRSYWIVKRGDCPSRARVLQRAGLAWGEAGCQRMPARRMSL